MDKKLPTAADFQNWPNLRPKQERMVFEAVQPFLVETESGERVIFALAIGEYGTTLFGLGLPSDPTIGANDIVCVFSNLTVIDKVWKDWPSKIDQNDWQWLWLNKNGAVLYQMMLKAFAFITETRRDEVMA